MNEEKIELAKGDDLDSFRDAAARDTLKELGHISKTEYDYYQNLCDR